MHLKFRSLAIGRMFGGIPTSFLETYHKHMPKTEPIEQYDLRGDLYELFHYLNHTVLFRVSDQRKALIILTNQPTRRRGDTITVLCGRWRNYCEFSCKRVYLEGREI